MDTNAIKSVFKPASIAVIGASAKKGAIGNTLLTNFNRWKLDGSVYAVNPKYDEVEGFPCYPAIGEIPGEVDMAVIATPGNLVEESVREAVAKKVHSLIIVSSGFAEKGEEGKRKQEELKKLCVDAGIRVLGPNVEGLFNFIDGIMLSFIAPLNPIAGEVGIVSQSGATGSLMNNNMTQCGIGASYVATTGNQMDLGLIDFLEFLVEDQNTKIITAYMESVPDPKRFQAATAAALEQHKPIIALKSGKSEAGQRAAMSHTASLTGSYKTFKMAAEKNGVVVVDDLRDINNYVKAFRSNKHPQGRRVAAIVSSGASGIMLSDKYEEYGLVAPVLSKETQKKIFEVIPAYCSAANPIDIGSTWIQNPEEIREIIRITMDSGEVDALVVFSPNPTAHGVEKYIRYIEEACENIDKPVFVYMTTNNVESEKNYSIKRIPCYYSIDETVRSLAVLMNYEEDYQKRSQKAATVEIKPYNGELPETEPEVKKLLASYGIPVPPHAFGVTLDELLQNAKNLSYPLVAKVVSKDITHKSDVGGVVLKIQNEEELSAAYQKIMKSVGELAPDAQVDGVMAEEMVGGDFLEAIVGVTRDPSFGPIIMCGLGGIYVEVMKDVAQSLAPISKVEALEMINSLKSSKIFYGFRKTFSYDIDAFANMLVKISQLAMELGDQWTDLEINPLIVRPEGMGVMALDGVLSKK